MKHALRFAFYALAAYIVVDGDTIKAPYGVTYRLLGFDTPETHFAKCDAERELGLAAKQRLEELLATSEVKVLESGKRDRYGRTLATVTANGKDVGEILIGEGLARPYHGKKRDGWCGT
ncbi:MULTISPECIES: thermonuclease family protein [Rhodomicrobium]|uniref:thermonuclease family protein n=1 Tax=Rhodomicrobium TaxID=1068 RepID=UPI000B4AE2CB|nr:MULTISPECIES: thermonuclease family protein [Rhodomicrobium]